MDSKLGKFTDLLNISLPIIQAPMAGGVTTPELVAAVANEGGLGSLGAGYMSVDELRIAIKKIKSLTNKPFAVNLFIPEDHHATDKEIQHAKNIVQASCADLNFNIENIKPPYAPFFDDQMKVLIEEKVGIFSFTFGVPSKHWIDICKSHNVILIGTATTVEEAMYLQENGIDAIVAQGSEAGGHRGSFLCEAEDGLIKLSTLVPSLLKHVSIPVIASGGIMSAKDIAKYLELGASAVQMGTAFLCCEESGANTAYKKLLLSTTQDQTILTRAFSGKLARGLPNKFITAMQSHEGSILEYPIQNKLTAAMRKEAAKQNNTDYMSLWAGQGVRVCKAVSVAKLMEELRVGLDVRVV